MLERATREWRMSPIIATRRPSMLPFCSSNRERVEERLRRVLVRAVARVDDRRAADSRELVRRARRGVAYDDEIRRHRFEIARGVEQSLAFGDGLRKKS